MVKKPVSDLIFDKFAEAIEKDDLFKGISKNLVSLVRRERPSKTEIKDLLRRK
ncbi:MAG: hypothetical protein OEY88_10735 [Candidatus Bathyarchaeota archaeon]|nr:hypothetical protein [Candidatus Bathyarchaeota archaeon]